jgi:hypothetical protein
MKSKTAATWLAFLGGPLGLQRWYLHGPGDPLAWMLPVPTLLGLYGVLRARSIGLDDTLSWILIPVLGITIAGCAINALVYGLMAQDRWNRRFNPTAAPEDTAGRSNWLTVGALVGALFVGTTVLLASLAYGFQHYFEYQVEAARTASPSSTPKKSAD